VGRWTKVTLLYTLHSRVLERLQCAKNGKTSLVTHVNNDCATAQFSFFSCSQPTSITVPHRRCSSTPCGCGTYRRKPPGSDPLSGGVSDASNRDGRKCYRRLQLGPPHSLKINDLSAQPDQDRLVKPRMTGGEQQPQQPLALGMALLGKECGKMSGHASEQLLFELEAGRAGEHALRESLEREEGDTGAAVKASSRRCLTCCLHAVQLCNLHAHGCMACTAFA
jgi:hypothetical protein